MKRAVVLLSIGLTSTSAFADQTQTVQVEPTKKIKLKHKRIHTLEHKTAKENIVKEKKDEPAKEEKKDDKYGWMDNLSGNFMLTSNYVFRGISQTRNLPAVQGGLTYTLPLGIYLNVWGSNVKFINTDADIEIDTIAGIKGDIKKDVLRYDINIDRYNYPGARELDYNELNTVWNLYWVQVAVSYSGNAFNSHTTGTYFQAGINTPIPSKYIFGLEDVSFLALYGHYNLSCKAGCTYSDYNVAISKKLKNYTLQLAWTDTNGGQHSPPIDQSQIIGSVNVDF